MLRKDTIGDIWSKLEFDLSEICDLFHMPLETKKEAVGERISPANRKTGKKAEWRDTAPRWEDDELGVPVRAWLKLPYVDAIDQKSLQERLEAGKRLLVSVEQRIAARELTPELFHEWGLLNRWAGALQLVYYARPDVGRLREGSDNLGKHRRWFADYFLRIYKRGQMEHARSEMERFINAVFNDLSEGDERDWFSRFLSGSPSGYQKGAHRSLTRAFLEDLSVAEMKRLVKQPAGDIPSLNLDFPPP